MWESDSIRGVIGLLGLCLPVWLAAGPVEAATLVSLPDDAVADVGEQFVVCLTIDPLDGIEGADIDIAYDARVLDAVTVQPTPVLSDFSVTTNIQDDGWIRIGMWTFTPTTGGGCAVNITFETEQPGCSSLDITKASLNEGLIESTIDDGLCQVYDPVDQDGDGFTEAAGDCSDRFDWIHPGAAEICNGADDDCDGSFDEDVVCPCGTYVNPRNSAFWQRVCRGSSVEDTIQPAYVDYVNDLGTFSAVTDEAMLCAVMLPAEQEICSTAEMEFMALLLDVSSGRLCVEQPIDASSTAAIDVFEAIGEVDALLSDPAREVADCQQAADISTEINRGEAIDEFLEEEILLSVDKLRGDQQVLDAIALSWIEPDAAAAGRPTVFQVHRAVGTPLAWGPLGKTACHALFVDVETRFSPAVRYPYQVVAAEP